MLVDAAKGLETQTRKLFEVCSLRKLPTLTFINKMDRPARNPFEICDQIESEFELETVPMVWPIGDGDRFRGVVDRRSRNVHLYERKDKGAKRLEAETISIDDGDRVREVLGDALFDQLMEDLEILDEVGAQFDRDSFLAGHQTPVFFGSAFTNFGVELFLNSFLEMGRPPASRSSTLGIIDPNSSDFSGFVFKLQANMDPKHRDRLAFIRVVSGVFEKGMKVGHSRLPGRRISLSQAQQLFASDRESVTLAYPGDVVGVNNPGLFAIGDTVFGGTLFLIFWSARHAQEF
uniref:Tr-type G domain-containing protein n=1 Tax=Compsopogon caeruleus TaxID=31354 RepID=A0A6T6C9V2_9RHOD|mmetsp:Transcript_4800/g.9700  ORF Transcript_4800/g.9700 Transcript_4800/m.9700 type:complete len:290 (+) Transcript_4800:247-1116(+)